MESLTERAPEVRPAAEADLPALRSLVEAARLPLDGLTEDPAGTFVAGPPGQVAGCALLERYGTCGLLRSVAVADAGRSRGLGRALVARVLDHAAATGLAEVFLLTETAAPFFSRLGFLPVARLAVPAPIRGSLEFTSVCPSSAQAMARPPRLSPPAGGVTTRAATDADLDAIAHIYNAGIEDRVATFETSPRTPADLLGWFDGRHPTCVVVDHGPEADQRVLGFASVSAYRPRACYAGVGEFSVYVDRDARGQGIGRVAMEALIAAATRAGFWKLLSRVFVENTASRRLSASLGFREVGIYEAHARLDGVWRDVVIVERRLPELAAPDAVPGG